MINQSRDNSATNKEMEDAQHTFEELTGVLGLELRREEKTASRADAFIDLLLDLRQELREAKNFQLSDQIRNQLAELGVVIEDTPQGSTWHWE